MFENQPQTRPGTHENHKFTNHIDVDFHISNIKDISIKLERLLIIAFE